MDKNLVVTNRVFKQAVLDLIGSDEVLPIMDNDDDILTSEIFKQYMTLVPSPSTLVFDNVPTENSTNPVTSGGLYNVIGDVESILAELIGGESA